MDKTKRDEIIQKIRGCFALGDVNRNPSPEEAATALAMAQKLMNEYQISLVEIEGANAEDTPEDIIEERLDAARRWESLLTMVCVNLFGVKSIQKNSYAGRFHVFIGFDSDVALSIEVYKILKAEIEQMAKMWRKTNNGGRVDQFSLGVVLTLLERSWVKPVQSTPEMQTKINALVVVKNNAVEKWTDEKYPNLRNIRGGSVRSSHALLAGRVAGQNVGLSFRSNVGNSAARPLSLTSR